MARRSRNNDWGYGVNLGYLKSLVDYWRNGYGWRAVERLMNYFANFKTAVNGVDIHFIHEKGKGPKQVQLVITHGWPWSFWDMEKIIRPPSDPAAFDGDPADAFDC